MRICEFREGRYNLEILAWARLTLLYSNYISIMSIFSITKFIFVDWITVGNSGPKLTWPKNYATVIWTDAKTCILRRPRHHSKLYSQYLTRVCSLWNEISAKLFRSYTIVYHYFVSVFNERAQKKPEMTQIAFPTCIGGRLKSILVPHKRSMIIL